MVLPQLLVQHDPTHKRVMLSEKNIVVIAATINMVEHEQPRCSSVTNGRPQQAVIVESSDVLYGCKHII